MLCQVGGNPAGVEDVGDARNGAKCSRFLAPPPPIVRCLLSAKLCYFAHRRSIHFFPLCSQRQGTIIFLKSHLRRIIFHGQANRCVHKFGSRSRNNRLKIRSDSFRDSNVSRAANGTFLKIAEYLVLFSSNCVRIRCQLANEWANE